MRIPIHLGAEFAAYAKVGVTAFGLGPSLYKPGFDASEVATRARAAVVAYFNRRSAQVLEPSETTAKDSEVSTSVLN